MTSKEALFQYCLRLGDNNLILGHRLSEWCGHGPILEEDIALTNIALDHLGQSSLFLKYAAEVQGDEKTEDDLAFFRDVLEFKNLLLVEQENGDYAKTIVRQFFYSVFSQLLFSELVKSKDEQLSAIAEKSLKEVTYHVRHSSDWVLRLGDGTEESHKKAQEAVNDLWMYTGEMFTTDEVEITLMNDGVGVDVSKLKEDWLTRVSSILTEATLTIPESTWMAEGGKQGRHTEKLGYILADMQYLQRAYPGCEW